MITKKIKEMIVSLSPKEISLDAISETTDLIKDLEFNSILIVQLIVNIESEFGFEFDDEMLGFETLVNLQNLAEYVNGRVKEVSQNER